MSEPTFKTSESQHDFIQAAERELKASITLLQITLDKIEAARKISEHILQKRFTV